MSGVIQLWMLKSIIPICYERQADYYNSSTALTCQTIVLWIGLMPNTQEKIFFGTIILVKKLCLGRS